jgi:hypothetical protein
MQFTVEFLINDIGFYEISGGLVLYQKLIK